MTCRSYRQNFVKQLSFCLLLFVAGCGVALGKPTPVPPIYINSQPIVPPEVPPQVDAAIFVNSSLLIASNDFLLFPLFPTPYEAQSVRFWTNNGVMVGLPGFNFEYVPNPAHLTTAQRRRRGANLPQPSTTFFSDGQISASDVLNINAKEIVNRGLLLGDLRSRIRIHATNGVANLSGAGIRAGELPLPTCITAGGFVFDPLVRSIYFAFGTNGSVNSNQFWQPFFLPTLGFNLQPPSSAPPPFQRILINAVVPGGLATNRSTNLIFGLQHCGDYGSFVHVVTNITTVFAGGGLRDVTNLSVRMVFVPTNGFNENASVQVRFQTNFFFGGNALVEFRTPEFDVIEQRVITNYVTVAQSGLSVSLFRGRDCAFDTYSEANAPYDPALFFDGRFVTNRADYLYTAQLEEVGNTNSFYYTNQLSAFINTELGRSPEASDPTNFNGRVEIKARTLDLSQTRIRAENAVDIYASNLVGNATAAIDSPFISLNASTTNSSLVISNLVRPLVNRLQGTFESWAATWSANVVDGLVTNTVMTNGTNILIVSPLLATWDYEVMVLGSCITTEQPAIMHKFALQAPNVIIQDKLAVNNSFKIVGQSLTFGSNSTLALPVGSSLAFTNVIRVTRFTNEGIVNVPDSAFFGAFEEGYVPPKLKRNKKKNQEPRLVTYESFINRNILAAASVSARAGYVENAGTPFVPGSITATNGAVQLDGADLVISNAVISASADVILKAGELLAARSQLSAGATNGGRFTNDFLPGAIIIDATNSLSDGGLNASNDWRVTTGVRLARRPGGNQEGAVGDLMGTRIVVRSGTFAQSTVQWAGEDRGATVSGYVDNLAVGRLVLDGTLGNLFHFQGAAPGLAIYVDYLELLNAATNYNFAVGVDPRFTIYFADSNISPEKLEEVGAGRIRWVSDFTGPQSSTNIVYPDGTPHTFNAGVVRSKDRDDDGDGVVNAEDCTPLPVPGFDSTQPCVPPPAPVAASAASMRDVALSISAVAGRRQVVLNWDAPANSDNTVEFADSLDGRAWRTLTNFVNGPVNTRVSVRDAVGTPLRVYRVRVDAGKP